jgi:hypothetical protein
MLLQSARTCTLQARTWLQSARSCTLAERIFIFSDPHDCIRRVATPSLGEAAGDGTRPYHTHEGIGLQFFFDSGGHGRQATFSLTGLQ